MIPFHSKCLEPLISFYFITCEDPHEKNFIEIAFGWEHGHIWLHTTLEGLWPHYTISEVCWDGLWTLPFGLSQFYGHVIWLVCESALRLMNSYANLQASVVGALINICFIFNLICRGLFLPTLSVLNYQFHVKIVWKTLPTRLLHVAYFFQISLFYVKWGMNYCGVDCSLNG